MIGSAVSINYFHKRGLILLTLTETLVSISDWMYLYILVGLLIAVGLFLSIRLGFVQIRLFPETFRVVMEKKSNKEAISSFQALMVATASRVGTGNIAGIATALVAGGPGALMWMWIMAIIGGASAFAESTLAQIYKERDGAIFKGGPAYYIEKAMGMRWLGLVFATILIITFAYGFNGLQSYNIVSAFEYYSSDWEHSSVPVYLGIVLAVISMVLFFGGVDKISKVSSILVPIMAGLYIFLGIVVVLFNIEKFPDRDRRLRFPCHLWRDARQLPGHGDQARAFLQRSWYGFGTKRRCFLGSQPPCQTRAGAGALGFHRHHHHLLDQWFPRALLRRLRKRRRARRDSSRAGCC